MDRARITPRLAFGALGAVCLSAAALAVDLPITAGRLALEPPAAERGGVIYSTYAGIASPAFAATTFFATDVFIDPPANTELIRAVTADDFTVGGNGWRIDVVEVRGIYIELLGNQGPAASVDVLFLPDVGGTPPTDLSGAIKAYEALSYVDVDDGDFRVALVDPGGDPDPITLPPGTYWLIVQPRMALLGSGYWGWTESSAGPDTGTALGQESVWRQNGAAVAGTNGVANCVGPDWRGRVTECFVTSSNATPKELDAAFRFEGEVLVPGVSVSAAAIETSEAGATGSFDVVLAAPPNDTVTVPIGAAPVSEGLVSPSSLQFDAANWDVPQTVMVTPVDDAIPEAAVGYSITLGPTASGDPAYAGLAVSPVAVTNLDDDAAGVSVQPLAGLEVIEGGPAVAFTARLNAPLGAGETVTVPLTTSPPGLATVPATVVFTAVDGTGPKPVLVTPLNDSVYDDTSAFTVVTGDPTSDNPVYDALTAGDLADISASRLEDDAVGVTVTLSNGPPLTVDEGGSSASFEVVLRSEPLAPLSITLFSSDPSEGTISTDTLGFDAGNWDAPQAVIVTGQPDDFDDGDFPFTIGLSAPVTADPYYAAFDPADVDAVNLDDDTAGYVISPLSVEVSEPGTEVAVAIFLTASPAFDAVPVTLPLAVSDPSEVEISVDGGPFGDAADLEWTRALWQETRTVTVRGVDDPDFDGPQFFEVVTGDPFGGDLAYALLEPSDVDDIDGVNLDDESLVDVPALGPRGLVGLALLLAMMGLVALSAGRRG